MKSLFDINKDFNHHHHVVPLARISLTRSRHFSLSFIASGRSSGLHPLSSHSCCMYVRAGRPEVVSQLGAVLNGDIRINEFEPQSRCYIYFWIVTQGKCMKPLTHRRNGLNCTTTFIFKLNFDSKKPMKIDMSLNKEP